MRGQLSRAGKQVLPDMAVAETPEPVGDDRRHEEPREGQVPVARQREVIIRRYGEPARESSVHRLIAWSARDAQEPGRANRLVSNAHITLLAPVPDLKPRVVGIRAVLAPVEARMSVEDHQAGHEHDQDDGCVQPMPNPGWQPVAIDDWPRDWRRVRAGGWKSGIDIGDPLSS